MGEFVGFENNMPKNRTDEQFNNLMNRYMLAAINGRAEFYLNAGAALRSAELADAPESVKVKAEADAKAAAHEKSEKYIKKQERHLKRRCQYARAAQYAQEYSSAEASLVRQRRQAHVRDPHPWYVRHAPKDQEDSPASSSAPNPPWCVHSCQPSYSRDDQAR